MRQRSPRSPIDLVLKGDELRSCPPLPQPTMRGYSGTPEDKRDHGPAWLSDPRALEQRHCLWDDLDGCGLLRRDTHHSGDGDSEGKRRQYK